MSAKIDANATKAKSDARVGDDKLDVEFVKINIGVEGFQGAVPVFYVGQAMRVKIHNLLYNEIHTKRHVDQLHKRIMDLEDALRQYVTVPEARETILCIMGSHPNITSKDLRGRLDDKLHVPYWYAIEQLEKEKLIVRTGHGRGYPSTYAMVK